MDHRWLFEIGYGDIRCQKLPNSEILRYVGPNAPPSFLFFRIAWKQEGLKSSMPAKEQRANQSIGVRTTMRVPVGSFVAPCGSPIDGQHLKTGKGPFLTIRINN